MTSVDPNPQARPLWKGEDYKTSTSTLMCLQQEQSKRSTPHIPMHMMTRQHNTLVLQFDNIRGGPARTGRCTSRHRLHPLLRLGHKTGHGGILNTGKILNNGESGNQKNGKTKSGGRNGTRRQQTIHVHTSIRKLMWTRRCFNCCPSLSSSFFFCSLSSSLFFCSLAR